MLTVRISIITSFAPPRSCSLLFLCPPLCLSNILLLHTSPLAAVPVAFCIDWSYPANYAWTLAASKYNMPRIQFPSPIQRFSFLKIPRGKLPLCVDAEPLPVSQDAKISCFCIHWIRTRTLECRKWASCINQKRAHVVVGWVLYRYIWNRIL